jgi:hypothetical protein
MTQPFIACLCSTYKRPAALANAVACFLAQDYACHRRELFVLDDGGQYYGPKRYRKEQACTGLVGRYRVISTKDRLGILSEKHNFLASWSNETKPDIYAVWDDDDVYLPWHLSAIAAAYERGGEFLIPSRAHTTYDCGQTGRTVYEPTEGENERAVRWHSSWAFTRELFERVGGYPPPRYVGEYDYHETDMGVQMLAVGRKVYTDPYIAASLSTYVGHRESSYVCRVFNDVYNLTQTGGRTYQENWDRIGRLPAPFVGDLVPKFDDWTKRIYKNLCGVEM